MRSDFTQTPVFSLSQSKQSLLQNSLFSRLEFQRGVYIQQYN